MPTCVIASRPSLLPSNQNLYISTPGSDSTGPNYDGAGGSAVLTSRLRRWAPNSLGGGLQHDFQMYCERVGTAWYWEHADYASEDPVPETDAGTLSSSTVFSIDTMPKPSCGANWGDFPDLPSEYLLSGFFVDSGVVISSDPTNLQIDITLLSENPGEQIVWQLNYSGPAISTGCTT